MPPLCTDLGAQTIKHAFFHTALAMESIVEPNLVEMTKRSTETPKAYLRLVNM